MPNDTKEIRFNVDADTSAFDQKMRQIKQSVQEMDRMKNTFGGSIIGSGQTLGTGRMDDTSLDPSSGFSKQAQQVMGKQRTQTLNELRERFNLEQRLHQANEKRIDQINKALEQGRKTQEEINKLKAEESELIEKNAEITQRNMQRYDLATKIDNKPSGFKGVRHTEDTDKPTPPPLTPLEQRWEKAGFNPQKGMGKFMSGFGISPLQALTSAIGALTAGLQVATSVWKEVAEKQTNIALARGGAAREGSAMWGLQRQGRGLENLVFAQERAKAYQIAGKEFESRRARDITEGSLKHGMIGAGVGIATGIAAGVGAGVVSANPAVGLAAGWKVGTATAAATTAFSAGSDKQFRGAVLNTEEYRTKLKVEQLQKANRLYQAHKDSNVLKTSAYEDLQQQLPFFEDVQKSFGIANPGQKGTLIDKILNRGVSQKRGIGIGKSIMQAAGITAEGANIDNIHNSYKLQQAGLTNMPQVMGGIAGLNAALGGGQTTDESMKKLFREAVSAGLEDTNMPQEMRQFTQTSLQIAMQTGTHADIAAMQLREGMVGKVSAPTIEAAKTAVDWQRNTDTATNEKLDRKIAYLSSDSVKNMVGREMTWDEKMKMSTMRKEDMHDQNPMYKKLKKSLGLTDKQMKGLYQSTLQSGSFATKEGIEAAKQFQKATEGMTPEQKKKWMLDEGLEITEKMQSALHFQGDTQGLNLLEILGVVSKVGGTGQDAKSKKKKKYRATRKTLDKDRLKKAQMEHMAKEDEAGQTMPYDEDSILGDKAILDPKEEWTKTETKEISEKDIEKYKKQGWDVEEEGESDVDKWAEKGVKTITNAFEKALSTGESAIRENIQVYLDDFIKNALSYNKEDAKIGKVMQLFAENVDDATEAVAKFAKVLALHNKYASGDLSEKEYDKAYQDIVNPPEEEKNQPSGGNWEWEVN